MGIKDDQWEGGLFAAFEPPNGESVLDVLRRLRGVESDVLLRDADEGASPVLLHRDGATTPAPTRRFRILGEIARGGIGVVYKGRDRDLHRDVALKVLRPEFADREDVVRRFVEEAQVGGQLQHPGIVPIYGLGLQDDGRPSFAMKLVKGQTLASLIVGNPRGIDLIAVFEQIAQTMSYAHSRGVIHRDLKPANVMIGAFGEVQIVDWGFAKVLGHDELTPRPDRTIIATVRTDDEGSHSMAGSVLGTPAYMPPEQALGHIDLLDERSDVFALGAILCEILTGQAPYTGPQKDQLVAASQCRVAPALGRVAEADAAEELKDLVRDCLSNDMSERPPTAQVVADRVGTYFSNAEARTRQAELDELESATTAARDRRGRRRALVLASLALIVTVVGGLAYVSWRRDLEAREGRAADLMAAAYRDVRRLEGEQDWAAAITAAGRAVDVARSEGVDEGPALELRAALARRRDDAETALRLAAADDKLLEDLEKARSLDFDHYGKEAVDRIYAAAVVERWPDQNVDVARLATSPAARSFAAAFDAWAFLRRNLENDDWGDVDQWARAIDPENDELRDAIHTEDGDALAAISERLDVETLPVTMIATVGDALRRSDRPDAGKAFLERARRKHPGDYWIHAELGWTARALDDHRLARRHWLAALSIRPRSIEAHHWLGLAYFEAGDHANALEIWRDVEAIEPDWDHGTFHIAGALRGLDRRDEARSLLRAGFDRLPDDANVAFLLGVTLAEDGQFHDAIPVLERSVRLEPEVREGHVWLGHVYRSVRRFADAEREHKRGVELDPEFPNTHHHLGYTYDVQGKSLAAIESYKRALKLDPGKTSSRVNLASALFRVGLSAEAMREAKTATDRDKESLNAWSVRADICRYVGDADGAIESIRQAARLDPNRGCVVGGFLENFGRFDEAEAQYRKLVAENPEHAEAHACLGTVLFRIGEPEKGIVALRRALEINEAFPNAQCNLGLVLLSIGRWSEGLQALRDGHALGIKTPNWGYPSPGWVAQAERCVELVPQFERLLAGESVDASPSDRVLLAEMLQSAERFTLSTQLFREAFAAEAALADFGRPHLRVAIRSAARGTEADREQAVSWLRDVLPTIESRLASSSGFVLNWLQLLKTDPVLHAIRDGEDRPEAWAELWRDVDSMIERARSRQVELRKAAAR